MPPGLPRRPPLAMKLWLFRRSGTGSETGAAAGTPSHSLGKTMSIESLEHMVRGRVKTFLRHTWLVTILGTIVLGGALWAAVYYTNRANTMRIAAGPAGGVDVKLVQLLTDKFAKDHDSIKIELVTTNSDKDSVQALINNSADLAVVPTTVANSADWPVVAILRQNVIAFIIPAPSAIATPPAKKGAKAAKAAKPVKKSKDSDSDDDSSKFGKVTDLVGKRIGIVTGNEATPELLNIVLDHYGVPANKVQVSQIDPKNLADSIHNNMVDVIFIADAATSQAITDAVAAASHEGDAPTFIEIDQADGIAKRNAAFDSVDIDAGTFGGNPPMPSDSLKSLSFAENLVARKSFNHSGITALSKLIYTSRLAIDSQMAGEVKIEAPSTDKDAAVLVHQGTLDYLNDNSQTFFDKYGDDIFYGMLIFPVFGSAIAGVASYLRSDGRTRRLRLLQRVLDLVRKAHGAQNIETLEQLQIDADNLVVAIIHQSEHEEFDETVRMSFAFALDQLRFAIAARRTAILDHAAGGASSGTSKAAAAA
jgi:TRAP-type uncharacterized transport system substrate-binding protein